MAVWQVLGDTDIEYIPCQYGKPLPPGLEGCEVYMVDFSAPLTDILALAEIAASILIIDHHKTAIADLHDIHQFLTPSHCAIRTVFDVEHSGAYLAWRHFHPETSLVPPLIAIIEDRDLWRNEHPYTREVSLALRAHPEWRTWLGLSIEALYAEGRGIAGFLDAQIATVVDHPPTVWDLTGDEVPLYNLPGFMLSDTLHRALDKHPAAPYAVGFFRAGDTWVYSLRSRKADDVDVSLIAKGFGGGGHRTAAGFTLPA